MLKTVVAEIISIGDELTCGSILDTNAQWLSQELTELGIHVLYHSTVGDDANAMKSSFRIAFQRAQLIIATGGLGPTEDDLTRQIAADVLNVPLILDANSLEYIQKLFAKRMRPMPENNRIQAYFPQGAHILFNPNGTAPGFDLTFRPSRNNFKLIDEKTVVPTFEIFDPDIFTENSKENVSDVSNSDNNFDHHFDNKSVDADSDNIQSVKWPDAECDSAVRFLAFPGVPSELKEMWANSGRKTAETWCQKLLGKKSKVYFRKIHSFGAGESQVEGMLPHLIDRNHVPRVGITASDGTITLRICTDADSPEEAETIFHPVETIIRQRLGNLVFGQDDQTLADVVSDLLIENGQKISTLEWATGGRIGNSIRSEAVEDVFICRSWNNLKKLGQLFDPENNNPFLEEISTDISVSSDFVSEKNLGFQGWILDVEQLMKTWRKNSDADYLLFVGPYPSAVDPQNVQSPTNQEKPLEKKFVYRSAATKEIVFPSEKEVVIFLLTPKKNRQNAEKLPSEQKTSLPLFFDAQTSQTSGIKSFESELNIPTENRNSDILNENQELKTKDISEYCFLCLGHPAVRDAVLQQQARRLLFLDLKTNFDNNSTDYFQH